MVKTEAEGRYYSLKRKLIDYSNEQIERAIMNYVLRAYNYSDIIGDESREIEQIEKILYEEKFSVEIENVISFFETLIAKNTKDEKGVVFTPKYISDYIVKNTLSGIEKWDDRLTILDPACGCGIFLVSAIEYLHEKFHKPINEIIKVVYGIEIERDNVRRCELVMTLLRAKYGERITINTNIIHADSLSSNWLELLGVDGIDCIIGNPPYVNPHDLSKETSQYLKDHFVTTKDGVFNIFYAFIEHAMKFLNKGGLLGYIIPNNFLSIKSAFNLRNYLKESKCIKTIIDFGDNMIFKPIRTYNCILLLEKTNRREYSFATLPTTDKIEEALYNVIFNKAYIDELDSHSWILVDSTTQKNLNRIEGQLIQIKQFIRTGIATLRDNVYFLNEDTHGYYKMVNEEKRYVEKELVKPIYKIPDLKLHDCTEEVKRFIIFPYKKANDGYELVKEDEMREKYPLTYNCLCQFRTELDKRDNGKGVSPVWYAYGRTQGLNKYGKKLLFPTFSCKPKFIYIDDEDALFCNGYAVFENEIIDLHILKRVLNSFVMQYYVMNTSYPIEGGYYCYQKKYIEKFSIPCFSDEEKSFLLKSSNEELDEFLIKAYELKL